MIELRINIISWRVSSIIKGCLLIVNLILIDNFVMNKLLIKRCFLNRIILKIINLYAISDSILNIKYDFSNLIKLVNYNRIDDYGLHYICDGLY